MSMIIGNNLNNINSQLSSPSLNQTARSGKEAEQAIKPAYEVELSQKGKEALASSGSAKETMQQKPVTEVRRQLQEEAQKQTLQQTENDLSETSILNPKREVKQVRTPKDSLEEENQISLESQNKPIVLKRQEIEQQKIEEENNLAKQTGSSTVSESILNPSREVGKESEDSSRTQTGDEKEENRFADLTQTQLRMSVRGGQVSLADMEKEMANRTNGQQQKQMQQQNFLSQEAVQAYQVQAIAFGKTA